MLQESLDRLLRRTGRPDFDAALNETGTDISFCTDDRGLKDLLPSDGSGLAVVTDDDFVLRYLRELDVYDPRRVFSVGAERYEAAESIRDSASPTSVVGIGGGRVLDVAKMTAHKAGVPLVSVPTAPTHDGLLSRNAALILDGVKNSFQTVYPVRVIIPEHMWESSGALEKAGRLDTLANIVSLQDVSLAVEEDGLQVNNHDMSLSAGAVDTLLEGGEENLAQALFMSGLAMHESSRYCSGSEHELEKLLTPHFGRYMHGQLVGTAALLASKVYEERADRLPADLYFDPETLHAELVRLFRSRGLLEYCLTLLWENNAREVSEVLEGASDVRPGRYTLWNKVESDSVDWENIINEMKDLA